MAADMEKVFKHNRTNGLLGTSLFANKSLSNEAQIMSNAYRTVEGHIKKEIRFRKKIKENAK